ncbi:hypothetical protein BJP39_12070 [Streptomyces sp. CC77]|nr:hypothetical protein BJP39_12070 [Streptomyces sp. CC77]
MTAPDGLTPPRALHAPRGCRDWSTEMYTVCDAPGCSVPEVRLANSQGASVHRDHSTGAPPEAVSVSFVVSPWERAETAIRPGPAVPAAVPGLMTSTVTSGAWLGVRKGGAPPVRALPAFS